MEDMRITVYLVCCVVSLASPPVRSLTTVTPPTIHLTRTLLKAGFHRDVYTEISLEAMPPSPATDCRYMLEESLPAGCFVDVYQIYQMREFGGPEVWTESVIDLEKPEYVSSSNHVYVYLGLTEGRVTPVTLPLHLRYHRPSPQGYASVQVHIPPPRLFYTCTGAGGQGSDVRVPCNSSTTVLCSWSQLHYHTRDGELVGEVPVGQTAHQLPITILTLLAAVVACGWLTHTILNKPHTATLAAS